MDTIEHCRDDISPKKFPNIAIIHQNIDRVAILPVRVCPGLLHVASSCYIGGQGCGRKANLVGGAAIEDDAAAIAVCGTISAYSELVNAGDKHHESVHSSTRSGT